MSLLVFLVDLIYVSSLPNFSYSVNGVNILKAVPLTHWILLILSSSLLITSIYSIPRGKYSLLFIGLMYGFLFYLPNLYFIVPYEQTDIVLPRYFEFMLSSGKITHEVLSIHALSYLSYPVSFILETVIMLIGGIGKITIYTVGLFVFLGAFYVGLILYYYEDKDTKLAVLSLITYVVLSFYVINDQVAPQTLALALLPYLYKLTFDYIEGRQPLKVVTLVLFFWFALVFTHPFMFLFYVLPTLGAVVCIRVIPPKQLVRIKSSMIGLMFSMWGFGFIYLFYTLLSGPLRVFFIQFGEAEGETWFIFEWFFRKPGTLGPVEYTSHPHYELVPKWIVETHTLVLRGMLILLVGIGLYSFICHLKRVISSEKISHQFVFDVLFDVLVILSCGVMFLIGLITNFLGQRSFQVAFIPFSKYVPNTKTKKVGKYILLMILIIAPVAYTFNILTNLTVGPQLFVHDEHLIVAGYFGNASLLPNSKVVTARELYPSTYPTGIIKYFYPTGILRLQHIPDYIYMSPKFEHASKYYGKYEEIQKYKSTGYKIYDNNVVSIIKI